MNADSRGSRLGVDHQKFSTVLRLLYVDKKSCWNGKNGGYRSINVFPVCSDEEVKGWKEKEPH